MLILEVLFEKHTCHRCAREVGGKAPSCCTEGDAVHVLLSAAGEDGAVYCLRCALALMLDEENQRWTLPPGVTFALDQAIQALHAR